MKRKKSISLFSSNDDKLKGEDFIKLEGMKTINRSKSVQAQVCGVLKALPIPNSCHH